MDLTIPYTFYPSALPHWIAWVLFSLAILSGTGAGILGGRGRGWVSGLRAGLIGGLGLLFLTMVASMFITFFLHTLSS